MKRLRILLADDHELIRRGARAILDSRRGWRVVAEAADGREAVEQARELKPDVAIVDIGMPELDGLEVVGQMREAVPNTKVLMLTMHDSDLMVRRALDSGACGYLLKSDLSKCLTKAVKADVPTRILAVRSATIATGYRTRQCGGKLRQRASRGRFRAVH